MEKDMVSVNLFTRMFTIMETLYGSDSPFGDSWIEQQHLHYTDAADPLQRGFFGLPPPFHSQLVLLLGPTTGSIPMGYFLGLCPVQS